MIWKSIPGYEGLYEVSETGAVRSLPRRVASNRRLWGRMLKPVSSTASCTPRVNLSKDGVLTWFTIAELILMAFRGLPKAGQQCCFLDGDHINIDISNLRWATIEEVEPGSSRARRSRDDYYLIVQLLVEGWSQKEIALQFSLTPAIVNQIYVKWKREQEADGNMQYSRDPRARTQALRKRIIELRRAANNH